MRDFVLGMNTVGAEETLNRCWPQLHDRHATRLCSRSCCSRSCTAPLVSSDSRSSGHSHDNSGGPVCFNDALKPLPETPAEFGPSAHAGSTVQHRQAFQHYEPDASRARIHPYAAIIADIVHVGVSAELVNLSFIHIDVNCSGRAPFGGLLGNGGPYNWLRHWRPAKGALGRVRLRRPRPPWALGRSGDNDLEASDHKSARRMRRWFS